MRTTGFFPVGATLAAAPTASKKGDIDMKQWCKRAASVLLVLTILATCAAAAGPEVLQENQLPLADSLRLGGAALDAEKGTATEQVLTYTPGGDVTPMVVFGDTLYGRSTMDYIQAYLAKQGYTAVGAVNASFFDMNNGIPYGMIVTDGVLRTSGNVNTVGIWSDGTIRIGLPELHVELSYVGGNTEINYNKALTKTNGFNLYSRDYDEKTKNTISAYNLILEPETDVLTVDCQVKAKVRRIVDDTASCDIPAGCFVLSLATDTAYASAMEAVETMQVGDTVTITATVDRAWEAVAYAVGGGELLVENGRALSDFTLDTADKQAARTALGVKSNGDVVCYTVDHSETSKGMTLEELAERMADLGCVTAVNLDGGGSTCVGVTLPGYSEFTTVNEPSDGKQRPCANFLFFVRPTTRAGAAARLFVYPYDAAVLPGGELEMTVKAADYNYMAASVPGGVTWSATNGSMSGNVFTAGRTGTAVVTATAGSLTGSAKVLVVETPTSILVRRADQDKALTSLTVESGSTVDLTAEAEYLGAELAAKDSSFTWTLSEGIGSVTADGVLTAGENNAKGELTVSCGDLTVAIPVEVKANPFVDMKGHWAKEYVSELYFQGVLQGSADTSGQMVFRPDASMTRQEFVVALIRYLGVDTNSYAGAELPFADQNQIADWALDAMKTAYRLGYLTGSQKGDQVYANPKSTISREEAMTILARTQNASSDSDALNQFSDQAKTSDWARPYLTAMVEQGIINGSNGKLNPKGDVTRAQVAKMLYAMG